MGLIDKTILPSALPVSYEQRVRWESFVNSTNEKIPPFAIMQLHKKIGAKLDSPGRSYGDKGKTDDFICQFNRDGKIIWSVKKCDEEAASRQNAAEFMFNGNKWVLPGTIGRGTFDLPAQVLHDGAHDSLPSGRRCGPAADFWWVYSSGSAFTCRSHDAAEAAGGGNLHTVWLSAGSGQASFHGVATGGPTTLEDKAAMPVGSIFDLAEGVDTGAKGLLVRFAGLYLFGFHATLSSLDAPRGSWLTLALRKIPVGTSPGSEVQDETTGWQAVRANEIEEDEYGHNIAYSAEHVSVTGIINLKQGDEIFVRNDSGYAVKVANTKLWLAKHAAYWDRQEPNSGLSFGG